MKKNLYSLIGMLAFMASCFAQAPSAFKYQAVVRNSSNVILSNKAVGIQLTIIQGSITGTKVYTETFAPSTNTYGLVNLEIGKGTSTDVFTDIDWSNGPYFIETAIDVNGGTSYAVMGTSQFMSVPYALHSKTSETSINDKVDDADADPSNELQAISFSNDTMYLSNGGSVYLGAYAIDNVEDADADPTNELQAISFSNDTLYLSNGGSVYLGGFTSGWTQVGKNLRATKRDGSLSIGTNSFLQKVNIGDTGLFRMQIGHSGNFNEVEAGRLAFTEDIESNGTCGFEFHLNGAENTLSLESGCSLLSDTSIVFTRIGEVRIPERVSIGVNKNPTSDVHIEQSSASTSPNSAGIRFFQPNTTTNYWSLWNSTNDFSFGYNATRVAYITTAGSYTQASDLRLKNSIVPIGGALNGIMKLRPVEYIYNHDPKKTVTKGFIAQEVQTIFPEMVGKSEGTDLLALKYDEFGVLAIKAIQEQQAIIDAQQKQINEMKATLDMLQKVIKIDETVQKSSVEPIPNKTNANPTDADQK